MISEGVAAVPSYPHVLVARAATIAFTLQASNFPGDALRDALDPFVQTRQGRTSVDQL